VTTLRSKTNTVKAAVVSENRQHIKISISQHKIVKLTYLFAVGLVMSLLRHIVFIYIEHCNLA